MVSLSLLLTVQGATGSYAVAGAALGAFGVPVVVNPFKSRLIDRFGRRRVLPLLGLGYAATLTAFAAGPIIEATSAAYVGLGALAGLLTPPVGPVMRVIWASLTPTGQARYRAYSLDAVSEEVSFAAGPFLVAGAVSFAAPSLALEVTALLALAGSGALAAGAMPDAQGTDTSSPGSGSGTLRDEATGRGRQVVGPLVIRDFRWIALAMLAVGLGTAPLEVGVVARAAEAGDRATAGLLLGVLSIASAVGGLLWGRRRHRRRPTTQFLALIAVLTAGVAAAGGATSLLALAGALAVSGLAVAPAFVVAYVFGDALVPESMHTEASTWIATTHNLGGAVGAFAAGTLIDAVSARGAFLFGAVTLAASGLALLARRP
jgi:MFS family permease